MSSSPSWFVKGDVDGFIGLALDNMIQFLLILGLCGGLLGMGTPFVVSRILPAAALSIVIGNIYYALQARALASRTGRDDVTAQPYGINTPSVFAYVFLVMLPAKFAAEADGQSPEQVTLTIWQVGLAACLVSGLIETAGALVAHKIRKATPRAALLSTLAGIAISFIAIDFALKTFALPLIALLPLAVVLATYFARIPMPLGLPGGLWAVALGTAGAWICAATGEPSPVSAAAVGQAQQTIGLYWPTLVWDDVMAGFSNKLTGQTLVAVMLPMGLFNVLGSMQNVESAEAAGDEFPTGPSLLVNGLGSSLGAVCGSPFPTTIYIGHPGWKAMGARIGYSLLNGVVFAAIALSGLTALVAAIVPLEAGMAIVLYIGIVMTAQAFQTTPKEHAPAVAMGIFPGIAAWGALVFQLALVTGVGPVKFAEIIDGGAFSAPGAFNLAGLVALSAGFLLSAMIWAAMTAELIDRRPLRAATWGLIGAVCAFFGLIHTGTMTPSGVVQTIAPMAGWRWAIGYAAVALFFLVLHLLDPEGQGEAVGH